MLKWWIGLLFVGLCFYLGRNWSTVSVQVDRLMGEYSKGFASPTPAQSIASGTPSQTTPVPEVWAERSIAGLQAELPFPLQPFTPPEVGQLPRNIIAEWYRAEANGREIALMHLTNTMLAGGLMLSWADRPFAAAADKLELDVISANSATTMLHGFRARRSDYISRGTPHIRVRCLLIERGNQGWLIECHALESDPTGEQFFQRIVYSVHS